jgi:4-hydroxyphenylpyruvate dioxygenase-like putative hemolysin
VRELAGIALPPVMQVGFAVRDAESAAAFYENAFGLGPFELQEACLDGDYECNGKASSCRMKIATAMSGQVQIELIEMLEGDHPSGDFIEQRGEGISHLAFEVDDLGRMLVQLEQHGVQIRARGSVALESGQALRYAWVFQEGPGAPMIEFVEYT